MSVTVTDVRSLHTVLRKVIVAPRARGYLVTSLVLKTLLSNSFVFPFYAKFYSSFKTAPAYTVTHDSISDIVPFKLVS